MRTSCICNEALGFSVAVSSAGNERGASGGWAERVACDSLVASVWSSVKGTYSILFFCFDNAEVVQSCLFVIMTLFLLT